MTTLWINFETRSHCDLKLHEEKWKGVPNFEHKYEVSTLGRVRSTGYWLVRKENDNRRPYYIKPKVLALRTTSSGHISINLKGLGTSYVHALVLLAFVGPRSLVEGKRVECRHLNGNPGDNRLENLAWGTVKENRADRMRLCEVGKFSKEQVLFIKSEIQKRGKGAIRDLALEFHVDRHTITRAKNRVLI